MPTDPNDPLANQNIKDRFYGSNDPVADKLLKRAAAMPKLEPPTDRTVMTLYVGGLDGRVTEQDLRYAFTRCHIFTKAEIPSKELLLSFFVKNLPLDAIKTLAQVKCFHLQLPLKGCSHDPLLAAHIQYRTMDKRRPDMNKQKFSF